MVIMLKMRYFQRRLIAIKQSIVRNLMSAIPHWLINLSGKNMLNFRVSACVSDYTDVISLTFFPQKVF